MGQRSLRPWPLKPNLEEAPGVAVYVKIAQGIILDIQRGRLPPGAILPSTRELAAALKVNRKTVMLAFEELASQGWIVSQGRRGTFVSAELPLSYRVVRETLSHHVQVMPAEPAFDLLVRPSSLLPDQPGDAAASFSDGVPDTRLAPNAALARIQNSAMRSLGHRNGLSYGGQTGAPELRASVAHMLRNNRGLNASADEICITRGSQMAIYLAAQILCRPGDAVVIEELSYPPAWEAFRHAGAEIIPVTMDDDGLDPEALERICQVHRVIAIYLTPHHQYPTTRLMRMPRRLKLLSLAKRFRFAIIEDDYDHEFHFQQKPVLPLAASDDRGHVVYIGSLSKLISPGLRCGYLVATRPFIREAEKLILLLDRCGNPVVEVALAEALSSNLVKRHAARTLKIYEKRLEYTCQRLQSDFSEFLSLSPPAGGLAVWAKLTDNMPIENLIVEANEFNIRLVAGAHYSYDGRPISALRLGYASRSTSEMKLLLDNFLRVCRLVSISPPAASTVT